MDYLRMCAHLQFSNDLHIAGVSHKDMTVSKNAKLKYEKVHQSTARCCLLHQ